MSVIALPSYPAYSAGTPYLLSWSSDTTSPLGGPTQRILRLGSRFGIDVEYPSMQYDDGRKFLAAMINAEALPVAVAFPQRGFKPGNAGAPKVNGAGQTGQTLNIKGARARYRFLAGQFFSLVSG